MTNMIEEVRVLISNYSSTLTALPRDSANSAVMVPLFVEEGGLRIIFIKRSANTGLHRGQMGFPGGMAEPADGGDLLSTVLRESREEIGIKAQDVEIIGCLKTRSTIRTGLHVKPFVGIIEWPCRFIPDPVEVQSIHIADLGKCSSGVLGEGNRFGLVPPVYPVDGEPVWGLTARIVAELLEVLKPVLKD